MCEPVDALSEEAILQRLRQNSLVRSAAVLRKPRFGLQCTMWCSGCAVRASGVENVQVTATRTTLPQVLVELETNLGKHGADCESLAAAAKVAAAQRDSAAAGSTPT